MIRRIAVLGVMIVLAIWAAALSTIWSASDVALDHARTEARNLAASFSDEVKHNLDQVAAVMEAVEHRIKKEGLPFDLKSWAKEIPMLSGATVQASIVGLDGRMISSTLDADVSGIDLSDREHIRVHLDGEASGIFVGKPILSRSSHLNSIPVTRRVDNREGRLIGVLVFLLSPADLTSLHRTIDLGQHGAIVLTGLDSVILARFAEDSPDGLAGVGQSIAGAPRPAEFPAGASGFYVRRSVVDNVERVMAYRRIEKYPLVVTVGFGLADVLAATRTQSAVVFSIAAVASLLLLAMGVYLAAEIRRRAVNEAELAAERSNLRAEIARRTEAEETARQSEEMLQDAVDSLSEGLAIYDRDDRLILSNAAMQQMFPEMAALMQPGLRFEDIMRRVAVTGFALDAVGREEDWVAERVDAHRTAAASFQQRLGDGRWLMVSNRRMRNGGTASLRVDITELKDKEAALREAHAILQDALDSISEAFAIYDADERLVMCNEAYSRLYPASTQLLVPGTRFEDLLRHEVANEPYNFSASQADQWVAERLRHHRELNGPFEQYLPDGRHLLIAERRMRNGGIAGLRIDITKLKETEAKLRESRETLHDAVESISEAFVIYDRDDRFVMCNEAYRRLYPESAEAMVPGATFEEILRTGLAKAQYPDAIGREEEWLAERLRHHRDLDGAVEQQLPNGRHLMITERRMHNGGTAGLRVDVTRLKEIEARLRESQETLHDAVNSISEAFVIYDRDDRFVLCNEAYRRLYPEIAELMVEGATYEELLRESLARAPHPDASGREEEWITERLRCHRELTGSMEHWIPSGRHLVITEHRMSNGGIAGLRVDVTKLKETEAQVLKALADLERVQRVAGIGSTIEDLASGAFTWSPGTYAIFGLTPNSPTPTLEQMRRFYHPEDRVRAIAAAERFRRLGIPGPPLEYRIIRTDGAERVLYRESDIEYDPVSGRPARRIVTFKDITEIKATETQLRQSKERLDLIQRVAGIASIEVSLDTGSISWTPAACAIFGIDPNDAQPTPEFYLSLVHPADREKVWEATKQAFASGASTPPLEYRIVRPDGTERVLYRDNEIQRDPDGRPTSRIVTFKDVTELKQIEVRLQMSQQHLARAQQVAATGSFELDLRTGDIEWSEETYRIFGLDRSVGPINRPMLVELIVPEDREAFVAQLEAVAAGQEQAVLEYRIVRSDGQVRTLRRELELWRDSQGKPERVLGVVRDITELKSAEIRLREIMDNLDRAQRLAHIGSYTRDLADNARWSAELYRIFGVDPQQFVPTTENFLALVLPEDRHRLQKAREQIAKGICPEPFEYRIRRPSGEIRHVERMTELIFDANGSVVGYGGTMWDVTELRAAERRQRELEQQLAHSQKLEALGTLAGGIAHDLNNTLVPILSLAKLALMDLPEGSELREDLETISASSERARDLVKQILAFSRKQDSHKKMIHPAVGIARTLQMLRATLPANIALVEKIDEVSQIFADAGQLEQVVLNLVTNAAQAIGFGVGAITVEVSERQCDTPSRKPGFIHIAVADTGCGMDNETRKRIFEPFFTTKDVGEGTGLGLAVVHGIVTGHGGTIDVASEPGKGTVFTVRLPVAEQDEPLEAAAD